MADTSHKGAAGRPPVTPAGGLPLSYTPICAAYAPGPFLDEQVVTPSDVTWMNARTYIVRDRLTAQEFRALRILDAAGNFVGYWTIELLAKPLYFGIEFEGDRQDAIDDYEERRIQADRDRKRRRLGRTDERD